MSMKPSCPECGGSLTDGLADGLCPACLLGGLDAHEEPTDEFPSSGFPVSIFSVPGYHVMNELARGGMGIVYRARQLAPLREVALKMLLPYSASSDELRERFQLEARTLTDLDHPAILPIYETGEFDGLPWFSMKLATNGSLADHREEFSGRWRTIAELLATLSDAVQFAHEHGVLHRDLKPANILFDSANRPFVADFGLAKLVQTDTAFTHSLNILGTPQYLAPEVAAGSARHATIASDVYSLGAVLFELLVGQPPFQAEGLPVLLKKIADDDPAFPPTGMDRDNPVPRDLEVIALKCLAKNPVHRYASARELGDELRRYLSGEPIQARPVTPAEHLWRWCMRNRALASALAACVVIGILGVAGILWELRETESARRFAAERAEGEKAERILADKARERAENSERVMRENLYSADMFDAQRALSQNDLGTARLRLESHRPKAGEKDVRAFEWRYLWGKTRGDSFATLKHSIAEVTALAFSKDGSRLAFGSREVFVHDTASLALLSEAHPPNIQSLAFVPGTGDLMLGIRAPSEVWRWNFHQTNAPVRFVNPKGRWPNVCVSPKGDVMAVGTGAAISGNPEGTTAFYGVASGDLLHALPESGGIAAFSPDGKLLATGSWKGTIKLWDPESGALVKILDNARHVVSLRFSPDSQTLVECSFEDGVWLHDLASGAKRPMARGHSSVVWDAEISPDGRTLATSGGDQTVRLWSMSTGQQTACFLGHSYVIAHVAWSPDGTTIASGGQDGTVRLWNVKRAEAGEEFVPGLVRRCYLAESTNQFVTFSGDEMATVRDLKTFTVLGGPQRTGLPVGITPDGAIMLTVQQPVASPATIARWSMPALQPMEKAELPGSTDRLLIPTVSSDGRWLASGTGRGEVSLWNLARLGPPTRLRLETGRTGLPLAIAFSPASQYLAATFMDSTVIQLWTLSDQPTRAELGRHMAFISHLCFSPDGSELISADSDKFIKVWDLEKRKVVKTLLGHRSGIVGLDISPDGRTLASSSSDRTVRFWNLATGREVSRFETENPVSHLAFSPDGNALFLTRNANRPSEILTTIWRAPEFSTTDALPSSTLAK